MLKNARLNLKWLIVIAICLTGSVTTFAQDVITLKKGDDIQASVQEVGIDNVEYKKFDNPNGPIYTLKKSEILMIRYENGSKDIFEHNETRIPTDSQKQSKLYYTNGVWQNGTKKKPDQVREIMSANSEALQLYSSGRSLYVAGQVIAYPSAFILGWGLGTLLAGAEENGVLLGVGAAGTALGLIMAFSGESKIKTSVKLYNSKINSATSYQINFGFIQTGVGLCMRF